MALIHGANTLAASGFSVDNSIRFNGDAYLHKQLGTATNNKICTVSLWVKPQVSDSRNTFVSGGRDGNNYQKFRTANDAFSFYGNHSSSNNLHLESNRVLRDPTAFYHVVMAFDSTQATSTNRIKLYVNGVQETSFNNSTYPAEDAICYLTESSSSDIFIGAFGRQDDTIGEQGEGYFAEVCVIDGQALTPTSFGEYDEDSPTIWKPKDVSELTFGNNGFYLDFEDSSNLGNDVNGGTDLTSVSLDATDQATDTPTNNFATLNPLYYFQDPPTSYTQGNTKYIANSSAYSSIGFSTLAVSTGNGILRQKPGSTTLDGSKGMGICDVGVDTNENRDIYPYRFATGYTASANGFKANDGSNVNPSWTSWSAGNIISCALDLTNNKVWWAVNGTWQGSGDPAAGSNEGYAIDRSDDISGFYGFVVTGNTSADWEVNFGNPAYANTSDASDGNGYGNFEYAPPSGFFALCTKNLAEYG